MATIALDEPPSAEPSQDSRFDYKTHPILKVLFVALLVGGFLYAGWSVLADTRSVGESMAMGVFMFLGLALLIALGFEFVNGFHDTANAVATVIYTNSMPAHVAVVWSGIWNFIGVMVSSGAVAYAIITLLPVDLLLNIGSAAGFAMIFALLLAAVLWNLATWFVGLPNSSSHTLIGSVLGVGLANQWMSFGSRGGTSGVDWAQVQKVLTGLWMAPLIGFGAALLLIIAMRMVVRNKALYETPKGKAPPPKGIRALMIFICTAVSFTHGSNDGQKGMGLIMLILIGCAPTAYALNRTIPVTEMPAYVQTANAAQAVFNVRGGVTDIPVEQARDDLTTALQNHRIEKPQTYAALEALSRDLTTRMEGYGALSAVSAEDTPIVRNDMYLVLDSTRLLTKQPPVDFSVAELEAVKAYQKRLENGTRYIPNWVKVVVAIALGLGTMVGWKRIVITVGEKIGKNGMTYGQGATAGLVTAGTIFAADGFGLPVSTTHILSSSVAGGSVGNGGGLQARTIGNLALAWILTLPAAMALSGGLYWLLLEGVKAYGG